MLSTLQAEWGDQIKLVTVNADENLNLAFTYQITTLPTILLLQQGKLLCRLEQFKGRDDFQRAGIELQAVLKQSMSYSYTA